MSGTNFDWENSGPSREALAAFPLIVDEKEFPHTYSGVSWCAAYRIWKVCKDTPDKLNDASCGITGVDVDDLGLTGFMWGWAVNAVRQMLSLAPVSNPAVLTLGEPNQPPHPSVGPAQKALERVLGVTAKKK